MDDVIPISALNQYSYCPRRCYLIHAEQQFEDNIHTLRGTAEHEHVDELKHETRPGLRIERALPVFSDELGLSGRCDVVEFHQDGTIYPVEYKHGKRHRWINDDLQLAAQMVCLAGMTRRPVEAGAIFHVQSRRRREVILDSVLRQQLLSAVGAIRKLLRQPAAPPPTPEVQRCPECSLRGICMPAAYRGQAALQAMRANLFEDQES